MSTFDRKEREKKWRRKSITDAAEKLFLSKNYDDISMNDIAREVELNRATLYLYFENKEAIFFSVVLRAVEMLSSMIRVAVKNVETSIQKIWALENAYFVFSSLHPDYFRIYSCFQSGRFNGKDIDGAKEIIWVQKEIFNILNGTLKMGINDGTILEDIDPVYTSILIISNLENTLSMRPPLEDLLESRKISQQIFFDDFIYYVNQLIKK